jgi:hypothetical protein
VIKLILCGAIGGMSYHYAPQIVQWFVDSGVRDTFVGLLQRI